MKKSIYNIVVSHNEDYMIFNTLNSSCVRITREEFLRFQNDEYTEEEKNIYHHLKIVIDDEIDEYLDVVSTFCEDQYKYDDKCCFTILSTTFCNASCYYCYENGIKHKHMSFEMAKDVLNFMISKLMETKAKNVSITWFGGEPLLNIEVIDFISTQMIAFCQNNNIRYTCAMVSNGSLITDEIILKMKQKWLLSEIQITLDGTKETYERIKKLKNAFETVIDAIDKLIKAEIYVNIRINYSLENFDDIICLIKFLGSKYDGNKFIHVYGKSIFKDGVSTSSNKDYIDMDEKFLKTYISSFPSHRIDLKSFDRRMIPCGAAHRNNYVINSNGHLVRCEHFVREQDEHIGYIGTVRKEEKIFPHEWFSTKFCDDCKNCKLLPICMGGCIALRLKGDNRPCFRTIEQVENELKYYLIQKIEAQK